MLLYFSEVKHLPHHHQIPPYHPTKQPYNQPTNLEVFRLDCQPLLRCSVGLIETTNQSNLVVSGWLMATLAGDKDAIRTRRSFDRRRSIGDECITIRPSANHLTSHDSHVLRHQRPPAIVAGPVSAGDDGRVVLAQIRDQIFPGGDTAPYLRRLKPHIR
jgi:hypothetical protein